VHSAAGGCGLFGLGICKAVRVEGLGFRVHSAAEGCGIFALVICKAVRV